MDKWGKLVEQRLQDALAKGEFANLPGKGKPLALDEDRLADPVQWMARHILRNSGMSVPWVEERQRIEEALALATKRLARSWSAYAGDHGGNCRAQRRSHAGRRRWRRFKKMPPRSTDAFAPTTCPSPTCAFNAASSR